MLKWFNNIFYSFPIQLVIFHLRSNHLLIALWLIFIFFVSGQLGFKLGFQYLFLDPEYLGNVDFWSFFFLGFAFGGFIMSWNLTTYLLGAQHFPFLATLARPFTKFSLNNAIIPLSILFFYFYHIISFQIEVQGSGSYRVLFNCLGLLSGGFAVVLAYSLYFHYTNLDITYYKRKSEKKQENSPKTIAPGHRKVDLDYIKQDAKRWKVKTFISESLQPRLVRSVAHYDSELLKRIFKQNHLNALVIQLLSMFTLVLLGYLFDLPAFRIPAGASLLILMSILVAFVGAVTYWFNEWRITVIVVFLFAINYFSSFEFFNHSSQAYGLDYSGEPAHYSYDSLQSFCSPSQIKKDKDNTIQILENWKQRVIGDVEQKPKMVVLSVSGGGLKSALWAVKVVQEIDSMLAGKFLEHNVLVTGASGGMIGMAYMRELLLRKQEDPSLNIYSADHLDQITQDMLNAIAFSIIAKDLFVPRSYVKIGDYTYVKDRGYVFEKQLNENTNKFLDKKLEDYGALERSARIPMLFITPSVVNDARRLVISPQGVSYMMIAPIGVTKQNSVEIDAVDFGLMFGRQDAMNLRFLTALRMNATYPYVLPNVHLPSHPEVEVMDAGFLDNYGTSTATRFIQVFKDWILEHTSGVILVQISSSEKIEQILPSDQNGLIESLINPLGIAGKVFTLQEFEQDNSIGFLYDLLGPEHFEIVRFLYHPSQPDKREASISFHITRQEKEDVLNAINLENNRKSLRQLIEVFNEQFEQQSILSHLEM